MSGAMAVATSTAITTSTWTPIDATTTGERWVTNGRRTNSDVTGQIARHAALHAPVLKGGPTTTFAVVVPAFRPGIDMRAMSFCVVGHRGSAKVPRRSRTTNLCALRRGKLSSGTPENVAHHPRRELPGVGVLAARVIAADQRRPFGRMAIDPWRELRAAAARRCLAVSASAGTRRTQSCRARPRRARGAAPRLRRRGAEDNWRSPAASACCRAARSEPPRR